MPPITKIASDLNVGDRIEFAGIEFELIKSFDISGHLITLEFDTMPPTKKPSMFIDCPHTLILKVLN